MSDIQGVRNNKKNKVRIESHKGSDLQIRIWIFSVTMLSAFVNITGLLAFAFSMSHYTGNFIEMLDDIQKDSFKNGSILIAISIVFIAGGALASFINDNTDFRLQNKYGEIQFAIGVVMLLLYEYYLNKYVFIFFLSLVLGTQNGLIRSYRSMGVKTTHVTGTFTDLGSYLGYYLKGKKDMAWRIRFEVVNILSFGVGTLLGLFVYSHIKERTLLICSVGYLLSGMFFFLLKYVPALRRDDGKRK